MMLPVGLWSAQLPVEGGELCLCKIKFLLALGCCMLCIFVWLAEIPESEWGIRCFTLVLSFRSDFLSSDCLFTYLN